MHHEAPELVAGSDAALRFEPPSVPSDPHVPMETPSTGRSTGQVWGVLLVAGLALSVGWVAHARWERMQVPLDSQGIELFGDGCGPDQPTRCEPYSVPHPTLGFAYRPGDFTVVLHAPGADHPHPFTSRSGTDGYRLTSSDPSKYSGLPELWIHGCSFTWGYAVDWDAVYPSLVQHARPDLHVRNYGGVGFGNVQALLQLRDLLEVQHATPPKVAVFAYARFHPVRNVAAPSVLRSWGPSPGFRHPKASLDAAGRLQVSLVPFDGFDAPDPAPEEAERVTMALFDEILALTKRYGIVPVLAVQTLVGEDGRGRITLEQDPVVSHARAAGFLVADLVVDHQSPAMSSLPWDGHPNARAHAEYARKLLAFLGAHGL